MNSLRGIFFITLAMAFFALEDAVIKLMTGEMSQWQVLAMIGFGASIAFWLLTLLQRRRLFDRSYYTPAFILRSIMEGFAAVSFVTALSKLDLSLTAAIFQATPLATTFAAALFLNEKVGWRRWSAISFGFVGVLIIIRPGFAGFEPAAIWPLIAVAATASRDLLTRLVPQNTPTAAIGFHSFLTLFAIGTVGMLFSEVAPIEGSTTYLWPIAVLCATFGYVALITGFRSGEVSIIMPFRYTRLIFSILLGMLLFSERPDNLTLLGSALIVSSGLYTFLRERRLANA